MVKEAILMKMLFEVSFIDDTTGKILPSFREAKKCLKKGHEIKAIGKNEDGERKITTPIKSFKFKNRFETRNSLYRIGD